MQSLSPSPQTFSSERVRLILVSNAHHRLPGATRIPTEFHCMGTAYETDKDGIWHSYSNEKRKKRAIGWCRDYCSQVLDPEGHILRLDAAFSKLLVCNFDTTMAEDLIVERACQILSRLPDVPLEFEHPPEESLNSLPRSFFKADDSPRRSWKDLLVVSFINSNVIRLALRIAMAKETYWGHALHRFVDTISELLQSVSEDVSQNEKASQSRFLVKAFLWSAWQRSMMLFFSYCLGVQLEIGFNFERNEQLALRPTTVKTQQPDSQLPGYMCRWAFELLRTDRGSMGVDFRKFQERYNSLFENRLPRCCLSGPDVYVPCDGKAPENCSRFRGMKIEDQSAHTAQCSRRCQRLFWDSNSFQKVDGARAVSIDETNSTRLTYIAASDRTMAVSHVWSHGQGGRPEDGTTGFNTCLHIRYSSIARSIGCDSYWMDTPCIPELHENQALRTDAINRINWVFANSKVTLLCDRDIMAIDASNLTLELQESVLAALLVSDWNVRAWTLLEAMRGRRNLHLLFKDEKIVPLKQILENVHREGGIDLAILFCTAQHLMPFQLAPNNNPNPYNKMLHGGYILVEEAGCILGHRYATREGDGVVIWSLLCDENASHSAVDFWNTRIDRGLNTGFLMSSTPRIKNYPGLSWAPERPDLEPPSEIDGQSALRFHAFDGEGSSTGIITEMGLVANWLVCRIRGGASQKDRLAQTISRLRKGDAASQIKIIINTYLQSYRMGALLKPAPANLSLVTVLYRGDANGTLLAVVGSNNNGESWEWRGIHEWDNCDSSPEFQPEKILIA